MKQTVEDLKNKMQIIKKTHTKVVVDKENLGKQTGSTETSITNRIQEIEGRIQVLKILQRK